MTRPSGRWTHHPTKGSKKGYNGKQRETRPSGRRARHPTKGNKKGYNGRQRRQDPPEGELTIQQRETIKGVQWEIKGDKTLAKADTPSIEGKQKKGYNGSQRETRPSGRRTHKKGHNGRQRETRPSGRRTHHPPKGNKKRYNERQRRQDPREGELTIQHRETRRGTMGDKGRQDPR